MALLSTKRRVTVKFIDVEFNDDKKVKFRTVKEIECRGQVECSIQDDQITIKAKNITYLDPIDDTCKECGKEGAYEAYAVTDEVWKLTGLPSNNALLHLKCLEKRIGRKITIVDLKDCQWNTMIRHILESNNA